MIVIEGKQYLTEAQWRQKKRVILEAEKPHGRYRDWYFSHNKVVANSLYCEEQTRPMSNEELATEKEKRRHLRMTRKERLSCKSCGLYYGRGAAHELVGGICTWCREPHTAWEWLEKARRMPMNDQEPEGKPVVYWLHDGFVDSEETWYYYSYAQTKKVDEAMYNILKELYIWKFGGWEEINLENSQYDGKIWW